MSAARQGSDSSMLLKMNQHHAGNRNYVASKREADTDFGIRHFAGEVFYDSRGAEAKINEANICTGGGGYLFI